jgi:undecaprenyl diphosphate synthase
VGDISLLPEDLQQILKESEAETAKFEGKGINVAVCYGARDEIVHAVNKAVKLGEEVTEESFARLLYTGGLPDPDLIIRTGKEVRLSNFLLYQAAYAELYFSDKMFPDFSDKELDKAIVEYSRRTRRFGKTDEQIKTQE